jgi:23S rRNA (guanosine2251-2'-O)-methyltransferase
MNKDLIIGIHSIEAALLNPARTGLQLFLSEEGRDELQKKINLKKLDTNNIQVKILSSHDIQEKAKEYFKALNYEYQRVPSGVFLLADPLEEKDINWLMDKIITADNMRILCLDQLSDIHNAGAIFRTAVFYAMDAVVVPSRKSFGMTPSFFRIASGATEYLNVVHASHFPKLITKLKDHSIRCVALSEHSPNNLEEKRKYQEHDKGLCLVVGKEDTGVSNAVLRLVDETLALNSLGAIKSLNVSVATAIALEKCFGQ